MNREDKILVTGGTGFLGSYILRDLLLQDYQNIHAIRRPNSNLGLVKDFEEKIQWHVVDLDDVGDVYQSIRGSAAVIHSAGLVSFAPGDRDDLYQTNVQGTATVVNACLEYDVGRLIHISSSSALPKLKNGQPITEKTKWLDDKHISHYGRSKRLAEIEVWRGIAEGLEAIILNPTIILGAGIWESTSCKLFWQVYDGLKYYPPGSSGYVDVRDVSRIAVDMLEESEINQSFIISESNYSFKDIFTMIAEGLGVKPPSKKAPKWVAKGIVAGEFLRSKITGKRPIITPDSVRNAYENFNYDPGKIKKRHSFIPIPETIRETTTLFREATQNNFEPKRLDPKIDTKPKSSL